MILRLPASLTPYILQPRVWCVCAWLAALIATAGHAYVAWHSYDTHRETDPKKKRTDGNFGHALIDFGGQWISARVIVTGHGRELYLRSRQREIAETAFPRSDEAPNADASDADNLIGWMVEAPNEDPPIGGPLYPPTHAVLFAPLGLLPPRVAYRTTQIGTLALAWLCGLFLSRISGGRFIWPVTTSFVMFYPGFLGALHLGQNSVLSLAILAGGWQLLVRGRPFAAGLAWALLAYKPTWAVAFALVPLLLGRWRMLIGVFVGGVALSTFTLPIVGVDAWIQWLRIGKRASHYYGLDENWIFLSRDLFGIPRRWMFDFRLPQSERDRAAATIIGWSLWAVVLIATALVAGLRRPIAAIGPAAAFVGLGAWLTCYHFIYYDVLLSALPVFVLLADRRESLRFEGIDENNRVAIGINVFVLAVVAFLITVETSFPAMNLEFDIGSLNFTTKQHGTPWETFALLTLWGYCGWKSGSHGDRETGYTERLANRL